MTRQVIDQTTPNPDGAPGDSWLVAFAKCNDNFEELYEAIDDDVEVGPNTDYIDGLKLEWVSTSSIRIGTGAAYVPGLSKVVKVASAITLSGLSLTASSLVHVFLHADGGTPGVELSAAALPAAYMGAARTKSGDTSRRYLGSIRTNSSGLVFGFKHAANGLMLYTTNINSDPFYVLSSGVATSPTNVSTAAVVPASSKCALLNVANDDSSVAVVFGTSDQGYTLTASVFGNLVNKLNSTIGPFPLDANLAFQYMFRSAPSSSCGIRVCGYYYER